MFCKYSYLGKAPGGRRDTMREANKTKLEFEILQSGMWSYCKSLDVVL